MDEKILIKSKKNRLVELILKVLLVISFIEFLFMFFGTSDFIYGLALSSPALVAMLVFGTTLLTINSCEIIVTNKRVYGKATFRKRIDLPLDSISAVGTSILSGIDIGTSSGRIHFKLLKNNIEIYSIISNLLIRRQQTKNLHNFQNLNSVDELKKFKELLDSGIITQDEFENKKRQLLRLSEPNTDVYQLMYDNFNTELENIENETEQKLLSEFTEPHKKRLFEFIKQHKKKTFILLLLLAIIVLEILFIFV